MAVQRYKKSRWNKYRRYAKNVAWGAGSLAMARYGTNPSAIASDINYLKGAVAAVKGSLNVERKYYDKSFTMSPTATSGTGSSQMVLLNDMSQGDDASNVDGRSVRNKTLQLKAGINIAAAANNSTRVRLVLVFDRYPQGVASQYTDVFEDANVNALRKWNSKERYIILGQKVVHLDIYDDYEKTVGFYVKFRGRTSHTKWNTAPAGTIAEIERGSIFILAQSDEATNVPSVVLRSRLTWIDN